MPPLSSPGTLTYAKAMWFSTSTIPNALRSFHGKILWEHTASPHQGSTTSSSLTSPGPWDKTTAWWSPPLPARRARACRSGPPSVKLTRWFLPVGLHLPSCLFSGVPYYTLARILHPPVEVPQHPCVCSHQPAPGG